MRHRLFKSLRITVTAFSLLACGLLIVLWVRSYRHHDIAGGPLLVSLPIYVESVSGNLGVEVYQLNYTLKHGWIYDDGNNDPRDEFLWAVAADNMTYEEVVSIRAPYWFYLTIFATIAAIPWIKWRFSLRTLLIVLTLFAVFFGAIAMSL